MNQYQPYGSTHQPYGRAPLPARPMYQSRRMHKAFGITYMCLRGIALLLLVGLMIMVAGTLGRSDSEMRMGSAMIIAVLLAWSAYGLLPENWSRCYESPERP